jgi:hypothetical protein
MSTFFMSTTNHVLLLALLGERNKRRQAVWLSESSEFAGLGACFTPGQEILQASIFFRSDLQREKERERERECVCVCDSMATRKLEQKKYIGHSVSAA